jgi:hypothetical protein
MSGAAPEKNSGGWPRSRVILLIVGLCIGIGAAVYLADVFSVRDRNITTQPATGNATEPSTK